jgi:hypothetical protein
MRQRPIAVATIVVAVVTLTGCATTLPAAQYPSPTSSVSATPLPRDESTAQSQPTHTLTPAASAAASKTASTVMGLYARPTVGAQEWINGLDAYLTQDAAAAFGGTDPSTIPAHQVTGSALVLPASTAEGALVAVPTDAGTYQLFLLRNGPGWLVDQITAPKN